MSGYLELRADTGALVGVFDDREVALRIASEVLAEGAAHVLLQTFDNQRQLVEEALIAQRDAD